MNPGGSGVAALGTLNRTVPRQVQLNPERDK